MASATYSYDALGNVTNDGTHAYTYDAENRMTQVDNGTTASYVYDAFSQRVRVNAGTNSRECVFDLSGACIAEMSTTSGAWLKSDIRALGQTIATYTGSGGTTYFNHADQIGSLRAQSTVAGAVQTTCTYDPFGSTFNCSGGGSNTRDQFTGDEHDSESGLEHTQFRQLNTLAGRWMSPDPHRGVALNPQTWNRYSYVWNNPLLLRDSNGKWPTVTHNEIYEIAFPGLVGTLALSILESSSAYVDRMSNQGPDGANSHGMCVPGQSLTDCALSINNIVTNGIDAARAAGYNENGLSILGAATHTFTDMPSPYHSAPDGTPLCWSCGFWASVDHFVGEDVVGLVLRSHSNGVQIAQSVRNAQAAFALAFPEHYAAATAGAAGAASNTAYTGLVMATGTVNPSPILQNEVTGCLLGNQAACPSGGDFIFLGIMGGGGGPPPEGYYFGGRWHPVK